MAVVRALLLVPDQGLAYCAIVEIAYEEGTDIDKARCIAGCLKPPAGALTKMNSAICEDHIRQVDQEGAYVLE
jgi:hypothetical protein